MADVCRGCGFPVLVGHPCPSGMEILSVGGAGNPHAPRPDVCKEIGHCGPGVCLRCGEWVKEEAIGHG